VYKQAALADRYIMPHVEGESLRDRLNREKLREMYGLE
jgi:hypothetical protein